MALIKRYLKEKRNDILIFILTIGIFAVFMALYLLPFKAIVYPVLLSVFLYSGYIAVDFISVKNKHDILKNIGKFTGYEPGAFACPAQYRKPGFIQNYRRINREIQRF